jgi:Ca2+-binding EF-hand superfamily protein
MPPEVWEHGLWTPRGDVFSLGVMIFSLRTGSSPFYTGQGGLEEVSRATRFDNPQMNLGSPAIKNLVNAMLAKPFLQRPFCDTLMQDSWFHAAAQAEAQPIDVEALGLLAKRKEKTELYKAFMTDIAARQNLAQLKDLNDLFMAIDGNNDGKVTQEELRYALQERHWSQQDVERLVSCLCGADGGSELSYDEFMGALLVGKVFEENVLLRQVFNEVDRQQKGWLSEAEVKELAIRPAIARVIADNFRGDLMKELDQDQDGRVTFEDFRLALGASTRVQARDSSALGKFRPGQAAKFWSRTYNQWMDCVITAVDPASGAVQMDKKPDYWLRGDELSLIKPVRDSTRFQRGQVVEMYSKSYSTWIPCTVTEVDAATGGVQVDQKPGYWFRGDALDTRLRATGLHPAGRHSAAAGLGRQLFDSAIAA